MSRSSVREFNRRGSEFGIDLLYTLNKTNQYENSMVSPLSVHIALGFAYLTATGKTAEEMVRCLRLYKDRSENIAMLTRAICKYSKSEFVSIGCKFFVNRNLNIKKGALDTFGKLNKTAIHRIDFTNSKKAARTINAWIEKKLKNKFKNVIDASDVQNTTGLIVSTIYFKIPWMQPFPDTLSGDFWKNGTEVIKVKMMFAEQFKCKYGELQDPPCKAIELPFKDSDHSMLFILPNSRTGINYLEGQLQKLDILEFRKTTKFKEVQIELPFFEFNTKLVLGEALKEMGMQSALTNGDFSDFFENNEKIPLCRVLHQTFICVNQYGVEAAAFTEFNCWTMEEVIKSIEFNKTAILFGFQLFQLLDKNPECSNSLICPLSLHLALGLLYMGSKGKAKEELVDGLHITDNLVLTALLFHHSICKYKTNEALKISNKYYIQKGLMIKGRFKLIAQKLFRVDVEPIDFQENQRAAQMINAYIASKIEKPIDKIIDTVHIQKRTQILIVSSIYFQGNWRYPFNPELTVESDFTTADGKSVKVQLMTKNKASIKYRQFSDLKCILFELPFADKDFAFLVFYPKKKNGIDILEQQLPLVDLVKFRRRMKMATVEISLPKFSIEYTATLAEPLKEMGMNAIFDKGRADFSNIIEKSKGICVQQVLHKAFLDINEYGVEVQQPNDEIGVSEKTSSFHSVKVDRPFLFAIVSRRHRLFFWGAVRNPQHVKCQYTTKPNNKDNPNKNDDATDNKDPPGKKDDSENKDASG